MSDQENKVDETKPVRKPRVRTSTKKVAKDIPETTQETTEVQQPAKNETESEFETVELTKEENEDYHSDDQTVVEVAVEQEAKSKKYGSSDYSIGTSLDAIKKATDEKLTYYPLAVWARNPNTMEITANISVDRLENGRGSETDIRMIDYAEQNKVVMDRHMFSFCAREGASWDDHLNVDGRKLRANKINFATKAQGNTLANKENHEQLITVLFRRLDIGSSLLVRLWHSGLVFAVEPLSKAARVAMVDKVNNAHLDILRSTNGIIHGSSAYYANRIIMKEFMNQVVDSNVDKSLWADIFQYIDHRDIQIMAWALMASGFQRGYNYVETCGGLKTRLDADKKPILDEDGKPKKGLCGHRHESLIDLMLLPQIDSSMFNDWQKSFIAKPLSADKATVEDIQKYQRLGRMHERDIIEVANGVSLILKAPNAAKHIEIGEKWIEAVIDSVDDAITTNVDEETRNEMIQRQMAATAALDVSHWVDGFLIDGEEIRDEEAIRKTFHTLSNNEEIRNKIYDDIRRVTASRLAAVLAVPTNTCPSCGELSNVINNNGTAIYTPIDAVSRFFILAARNP